MIQHKPVDCFQLKKSSRAKQSVRVGLLLPENKPRLDFDDLSKSGHKRCARKAGTQREEEIRKKSSKERTVRVSREKPSPERSPETLNSKNPSNQRGLSRSTIARVTGTAPERPKQTNATASIPTPESPTQKRARRASPSEKNSLLGPALRVLNIRRQRFPKNVSRVTKATGRRRSPLVPCTPASDMNIFCGPGLVRTQFILDYLEEVKGNPSIVKLELEDLFERSTDAETIAHALRELILSDDRPWESIQFADDIQTADILALRQWQNQKKLFLKYTGTVFRQKLIPVHFKTKVAVPDTTDKKEAVAVLVAMQEDKSITTVKFSAKESDPVVLQALVDLFQCDDRKWEDVRLNLSGRFYW